jgi:hypothetical protein
MTLTVQEYLAELIDLVTGGLIYKHEAVRNLEAEFRGKVPDSQVDVALAVIDGLEGEDLGIDWGCATDPAYARAQFPDKD